MGIFTTGTSNGTSSADQYWGSSASEYFNGGGGDDVIWGADNDDILVGGSGADIIYGGDGDDWLYAGTGISASDSGRDRLIGGPGNDKYVFDTSSTFAVIEDFQYWDDEIYIDASAFGISSTDEIDEYYNEVENLMIISIGGNGVNLHLENLPFAYYFIPSSDITLY